MRLLICAPLLLVACLGNGDEHAHDALIRQLGRLQNAKLDEASGLARSGRDADLLWAVNDDGAAALHALRQNGTNRGTVTIAGARNTDWEDLAAFSSGGNSYIIVADIGDNEARREYVTLYVVEEPAPDEESVAIAWTINFTYPDGPRDAESLAVDAVEGTAYVLSKRDIPAVLYALPLRRGSNDRIVATRLAVVDSLPQPSEPQVRNAAGSGWAWQPTAMDFSANNRHALILTYHGVYLYARHEEQSWAQALAGPALEFRLGKIRQAEAIALDAGGQAAFLTTEKKHAPLFRLDLQTVLLLQQNNSDKLR